MMQYNGAFSMDAGADRQHFVFVSRQSPVQWSKRRGSRLSTTAGQLLHDIPLTFNNLISNFRVPVSLKFPGRHWFRPVGFVTLVGRAW